MSPFILKIYIQELRQVRARLGEIYRKMVRVMDEMEAMRREEIPGSKKK